MPIGSIESVVYGTDDIDAAVVFYEQFGLPLLSHTPMEAVFRLEEGSRVIIRKADDPALPAPHYSGNGVRETVFGITSTAELDALAESLAVDRDVRRDDDGTIHFTSDCGIALAVRVWQRTPVIYNPDPVNAADNVKRLNQHRRWRTRARPKTINHVVWRVANFDDSWAFFRDRLGFVMSDYQIDAGIFARSRGSHQHHVVYFQQFDVLGPPPHSTGFDHVCFGVEDIDEIMAGWNYMARRGWANPFGGVGRHRISSAMFCYLFPPCGGMAEYGADTDYIDDSWVPRRWERSFGGFMWTANVLPFLPEEVEWQISYHPEGLPDGTVPEPVGQRHAPKRPRPQREDTEMPSDMQGDMRVIVIGAGIAGLSTAVGLTRHGIQVDVIESAGAQPPTGAGITLLGNALRALDELGLAEQCLDEGVGFERIDITDAAGNVLMSDSPPRTFRPDRPATLGIRRTALHHILTDAATNRGARIRYDMTVSAIDHRSDGADVTLSTGETLHADLVVAADGTYSSTRAMVFGSEHQPTYAGQGAWRISLDRPEGLDAMLLLRSAQGRASGAIPTGPDSCYVFVLETTPERVRFADDQLPALMAERLGEYSAPVMRAAAAAITADNVTFRPFDIVMVPAPWHRGRVVLIGDAAHSLTPQMTSGAGSHSKTPQCCAV